MQNYEPKKYHERGAGNRLAASNKKNKAMAHSRNRAKQRLSHSQTNK